MSQHDLDIANQTFPNTRSDLNDALKALGSTSSGATVPSTTYANQLWYDTANNKLYIRNEDNDANIEIMELDQSNDTVEFFKSDSVRTTLIEYTDGTDALTVGTSGELTTSSTLDVDGNELILDADGDTSITADTDDQIDFKIAGSDKVVLDANGLKINGSTSGGITISAPAVAGTNTLTLPASTGTVALTSDLITGPTFSATLSATQTVSASTFTKIAFATEHWDTDSKYDTSLYRFTPTVAGYYEFIIGIRCNSSTTNIVSLYKNGVLWRRGVSSGQQYTRLSILDVSDTDDYFEAYGFTTGTQFLNTADDTYFQAHFVRGL